MAAIKENTTREKLFQDILNIIISGNVQLTSPLFLLKKTNPGALQQR
jgi:hypothetical protein